jgi:hypothetical protein
VTKFKCTFFLEKNSYTDIREYESEFQCLDSLHDLDWFIVKTKKGNTTMINKDVVRNITICEVKEDE